MSGIGYFLESPSQYHCAILLLHSVSLQHQNPSTIAHFITDTNCKGLTETSSLLKSRRMVTESNHHNGNDNDSQFLRSFRHNPCLMSPLSGFMLLIFCLFSLVTIVFKLPEFLLGFLLSPLLGRNQWFVGTFDSKWNDSTTFWLFMKRKYDY